MTTKQILNDTKKTANTITIRFADLLVAAFGIVSALAWNQAVQSLFAKNGIFYRFAQGGPWIAAVVITLFAVTIGFWRERILPKNNSSVTSKL
jgi:hypothetical protein